MITFLCIKWHDFQTNAKNENSIGLKIVSFFVRIDENLQNLCQTIDNSSFKCYNKAILYVLKKILPHNSDYVELPYCIIPIMRFFYYELTKDKVARYSYQFILNQS